MLFTGENQNLKVSFCQSGSDYYQDLTAGALLRKCGRFTTLTGKEFLEQYAIIDRQIRSVKLQLDGMKKIAEQNMMIDTFQPEIDELSDKLKRLISESAIIKSTILDKILLLKNDNCRTALIGRYIELKSVTEIAKEIYVTRQGVYYHLDVGEKEIEKYI